jgi:ATP-dependent HslUV protease subunit HslV
VYACKKEEDLRKMELRGTTILAVKRDGRCAVAGDGQVTLGENTIMKATARKLRRLYHDQVVVGFAGSVADAFSLCERFEKKLEQYNGSLMRKLEALLIVANKTDLLIVSGTGEVIDPDDGIAAIGSGGMFALAAAKALVANTDLPAGEIARKGLEIASQICVYTNGNIVVEEV